MPGKQRAACHAAPAPLCDDPLDCGLGAYDDVGPCAPADITRSCGAPRSLVVIAGGDSCAGPTPYAWALDPEAAGPRAWAPLAAPPGLSSPTAASGIAGPGASRGVLVAGDCASGGAASFEWRAARDAPGRLQFACAAEDRRSGRAVVLGGSGSAAEYDAGTDAWLELPPRPTACESAAVAELGDRLVAVGSGGHGLALGSVVEAFDPREGAWQRIGALRGSRECVEACACQGLLYVVGGIDRERELADTARFDPRAGRWEELAPMLDPKYGLACAEIGGLLWTFGGFREDVFVAETESTMATEEEVDMAVVALTPKDGPVSKASKKKKKQKEKVEDKLAISEFATVSKEEEDMPPPSQPRGWGGSSAGDRDRGEREGYGRSYGDRYGSGGRPSDRDGDRPRYGDRDGGFDRPRYGDRDGGFDRPRYGDREGGFDRPPRSYGDREGGFDRPPRSYGDREGGFDRPRYGDREGGYDRPPRSFGDREGGFDRPPRSYGDREGGFGSRGGYDRPPRSFGDREDGPDREREGAPSKPLSERMREESASAGTQDAPRKARADPFGGAKPREAVLQTRPQDERKEEAAPADKEPERQEPREAKDVDDVARGVERLSVDDRAPAPEREREREPADDRDRRGGYGDRDGDRRGGYGDRDGDRRGGYGYGDRDGDRRGGYGYGDRERRGGYGYGDRDGDRSFDRPRRDENEGRADSATSWRRTGEWVPPPRSERDRPRFGDREGGYDRPPRSFDDREGGSFERRGGYGGDREGGYRSGYGFGRRDDRDAPRGYGDRDAPRGYGDRDEPRSYGGRPDDRYSREDDRPRSDRDRYDDRAPARTDDREERRADDSVSPPPQQRSAEDDAPRGERQDN
eukprot:m51a1_g13867 putative helicase domain protein (865) ;mRNA; f:612615-615919